MWVAHLRKQHSQGCSRDMNCFRGIRHYSTLNFVSPLMVALVASQIFSLIFNLLPGCYGAEVMPLYFPFVAVFLSDTELKWRGGGQGLAPEQRDIYSHEQVWKSSRQSAELLTWCAWCCLTWTIGRSKWTINASCILIDASLCWPQEVDWHIGSKIVLWEDGWLELWITEWNVGFCMIYIVYFHSPKARHTKHNSSMPPAAMIDESKLISSWRAYSVLLKLSPLSRAIIQCCHSFLWAKYLTQVWLISKCFLK